MMNSKGFTLIELLVVMAVIGVLTSMVVLAINPNEQLARARDTNRKAAIFQLGHAMAAFFTTHAEQSGGRYPVPVPNWQRDILVASGDIGNVIKVPVNLAKGDCTINMDNNVCYLVTPGARDAMIWSTLESISETDKSDGPTFPVNAGPCNNLAGVGVIVWIASQGRAGMQCVANAGVPPNPTGALFP